MGRDGQMQEKQPMNRLNTEWEPTCFQCGITGHKSFEYSNKLKRKEMQAQVRGIITLPSAKQERKKRCTAAMFR